MDKINTRIVTDSSSDTLSLGDMPFAFAPLKIITSAREYVDDQNLDVEEMVHDLRNHSGKSGSSCPSVGDWLESFGDATHVFCVTITSALSGSYNTACMAKQEYEKTHPGRRVFVLDSLSAGPEIRLLLEKLKEFFTAGRSFDEICRSISEYREKTGLLFMLESMRNLANNGRVNPFVARLAGVLGIRLVGKASDKGELEPLDKSRGEKRALSALIHNMKQLGVKGGKIRIGHCFNEEGARKLKDLIVAEFSSAQVDIYPSRGLCSFYQELGGLMVGFEKQTV